MLEVTRDFVRMSHDVQTDAELANLIQEASTALGFSAFALGHHVDLRRKPKNAISITSYDGAWVQEAVTKGYFEDDPILLASTRTAVGFRWSEVGNLVSLNDRHAAILDRGRKYGLRDGYSVPVHIPGEYCGTCSFGAESLENAGPDILAAAQLIGTFAFEAARRVLKRKLRGSGGGGVPQLSPRQIDCVTLVAQGKSDWEAAQILGLSQDTVHQHVEAARKRYGVAKRTQLVVRALYDGHLAFSNVIQ